MNRPRLVASIVAGYGLLACMSATSAPENNISPAAPGYGIAAGIASLARTNDQVDVMAVAAQLKLPEIAPYRDKPGALTWYGPLIHAEWPRFYAVYDPPHSSLNITHVVISWLPDTADTFVLELRVEIKHGFCPSEALLANEVGSIPRTSRVQAIPADNGSIGFPGKDSGYTETSLIVHHDHEKDTSVTYRNHNTCFLVVRGSRE
ncbi:hypothetical protein [Dyella acidiphila]|uniref:Lipoprotein n=1 Tax=Dyella acidiphila TaxID=2775866 RepID=A0ABR9GEU4_9GAMM|nr:hypothetical protein [Dyella acidiphila]MBE1162545.1 hypothetical protein [Dyella acidiphila]